MNTLMKKTNGNGNTPATTFSGLIDKIFQNNVNRLFDDDFWGAGSIAQHGSVPVNLKETGNGYELELVAPGLKKEDFKINVHGETLSVRFEQKDEQTQQAEDDNWLRKEYRRRSFTRSFSLDEAIDAGKISAKYEDGILHVHMPKKEGTQALSRTIEIK